MNFNSVELNKFHAIENAELGTIRPFSDFRFSDFWDKKKIGNDRRSLFKLLDRERILGPFSGQRILMDCDPKKKDRA